MTWILIFLVSGANCNSHSFDVEFNTKEACENARDKIERDIRAPFEYVVCVEKGKIKE